MGDLIIPTSIVTAVTVEEATELARIATGKTVLELGAYHGFSTIVLASVAERVISVDWHQGDDHAGRGDTWDLFINNLRQYGVADKVTVCRGRFEDEVPRLVDQGFTADGAFIDGMHDLASVERDLKLALMLVKPGGFIALHDYGRCTENGYPGFEVTQVGDRFGVDHTVGFLGWGTVPQAGCDR